MWHHLIKHHSICIQKTLLEIILFLASKKIPQKISNLQNEIWKYNKDLETHTVETHIYRLRKKIKEKFDDNGLILSTQNGYTIN